MNYLPWNSLNSDYPPSWTCSSCILQICIVSSVSMLQISRSCAYKTYEQMNEQWDRQGDSYLPPNFVYERGGGCRKYFRWLENCGKMFERLSLRVYKSISKKGLNLETSRPCIKLYHALILCKGITYCRFNLDD